LYERTLIQFITTNLPSPRPLQKNGSERGGTTTTTAKKERQKEKKGISSTVNITKQTIIAANRGPYYSM